MQDDDVSRSPLDWSDDGLPRSRLYDDVYFSNEDGLGEARAVFLDGCGLPRAWLDRSNFVVAELGFGTGLNVAALIELWSRNRPERATLHIFSVEAHPISAQDARKALARWPELDELATQLTAQWPGRAAGPHRAEFTELGVIVDVFVGEAEEALRAWSGLADAWFLDGFAPARNPAMWRAEVLNLVAARSRPGAVAATFTVAGQVRRGLAAAGFAVEKAPGFGRKRERLVARLPGQIPTENPRPRVAIIGAGIAGAAAARALQALGASAEIFDAEGPGAGASGNPAALVTPRLDAGLAQPAQIFAQAFHRAVKLYTDLPECLIARGALQLGFEPRSLERFEKIAASDLFEPGALQMLTSDETSSRLGEPGPRALDIRDGLVIEPHRVLNAWAPNVRRAQVSRLQQEEKGWSLLDANGAALASAEVVIVAAGLATSDLVAGLPLSAVRGQASFMAHPAQPPAAAFGGYVIPLRDGMLFGATNDRDDVSSDVRLEDHGRNLGFLSEGLPRLAESLAGAVFQGRASIRVSTPDYLPLAGPAPGGQAGLFVLTGFSARGFTLAPLLAEHVAAIVMDAPSPLPRALTHYVEPSRFARRDARRRS